MLRDSIYYSFIRAPDIFAAQLVQVLGADSFIIYHINKPPLTDEELGGRSTWGESLTYHKPDGVLSTVFRVLNVLQYTFRPGSWRQSAGVSAQVVKIVEPQLALAAVQANVSRPSSTKALLFHQTTFDE
jgi:hypothetical protein